MNKLFCLLLIFLLATSVHSQETDDENIFAYSNSSIEFKSESEMQTYLKKEKSSTFFYYEKLSDSLKKKVFIKHKEDSTKDLTEIVLTVYRNRN
jgi:hypothetical protein